MHINSLEMENFFNYTYKFVRTTQINKQLWCQGVESEICHVVLRSLFSNLI